jgi:C4-dicarboxylate-specific signal transduction histidine kinase
MKLPGAAHRRAERVLAGARRSQEVVDGMLRVRLKHREPEEGVDLEGVVDRAVHAVRAEFAQQNVTVDIRPLPGLPTIRGVAADLEQAMANLLRNAFQAVAACSDPHVEISLDAEAEGLRIVVQDNGQGMPPDVLERAFEPFFTTREVGAGRGLGLPIALGIVQEHGGVIELRSSANGTQAVVRLPVAGVRPVTEEDDS